MFFFFLQTRDQVLARRSAEIIVLPYEMAERVQCSQQGAYGVIWIRTQLCRLLQLTRNLNQPCSQLRNFLLLIPQARCQSGQTGVKSIEKIFFMSILVRRKREHRIHQLVISETVTRLDRPSSSSLRKLVPQAFHGELHRGS